MYPTLEMNEYKLFAFREDKATMEHAQAHL